MSDEDIAYLREMLERAYVCRSFLEGRTRSQLDDDLLLYYAVAKAVELIGEAAWHVSNPARAEFPEYRMGRHCWHATPSGSRLPENNSG